MADSQPAAVSRFDQFLFDHARDRLATGRLRPARGRWRGRHLAAATSIAAVFGVVALVLAVQAFTSTTQSAYASVLEPGDYLQAEGVVEDAPGEADDGGLTLRSEFGSLVVIIDSETTVMNADGGGIAEAPALRRGRPVVVSGLVDREGRVRAATIAVTSEQRDVPVIHDFKRPSNDRGPVRGELVWFAHAPGGERVIVALVTPAGERLLTRIDASSAGELFRRQPGDGVGVELSPGARPGDFQVGPLEGEGPGDAFCDTPPVRPRLTRVCGVVVDHSEQSLSLATGDGRVTVELRARTRLAATPSSGLSIMDLDVPGVGVGHFATVTGGRQPGADLRADVVLFGPEASGGER